MFAEAPEEAGLSSQPVCFQRERWTPILSCSAKSGVFSTQLKIALETKKRRRGPLLLNHPHVSGTISQAVFLPAHPICVVFVFKHGTFLQLVRANKLETERRKNKYKTPRWGNNVINQRSIRGN